MLCVHVSLAQLVGSSGLPSARSRIHTRTIIKDGYLQLRNVAVLCVSQYFPLGRLNPRGDMR